MSNYSAIFWRGLLSLILGLAIILWSHAAIRYIVFFLGVLLIVLGAISLITYLNHRRKQVVIEKIPVGAILGLIAGIILVIFPVFFVNIIMYLLGAFLIIAGIGQIMMISSVRKKDTRLPFIYYIMSIVILIAGIVVLFNPFASAVALLTFFGAIVILYGIVELFHAYNFKRRFK